jgi:hypothetical protein
VERHRTRRSARDRAAGSRVPGDDRMERALERHRRGARASECSGARSGCEGAAARVARLPRRPGANASPISERSARSPRVQDDAGRRCFDDRGLDAAPARGRQEARAARSADGMDRAPPERRPGAAATARVADRFRFRPHRRGREVARHRAEAGPERHGARPPGQAASRRPGRAARGRVRRLHTRRVAYHARLAQRTPDEPAADAGNGTGPR